MRLGPAIASHNKAVGARALVARSKHLLFHSTAARAVPHQFTGLAVSICFTARPCNRGASTTREKGFAGVQFIGVATAETLYAIPSINVTRAPAVGRIPESEVDMFMNGDGENEKTEENELGKSISEIKEWQDNQYNPGYYIGTGRVARPISSLSKYPIIILVFGIVGVIISILTYISAEKLVSNILSIIMGFIISLCLIYGGIVRLREKKKKSK